MDLPQIIQWFATAILHSLTDKETPRWTHRVDYDLDMELLTFTVNCSRGKVNYQCYEAISIQDINDYQNGPGDMVSLMAERLVNEVRSEMRCQRVVQ